MSSSWLKDQLIIRFEHLRYADRANKDVQPSYTHLGGMRDIESLRRYLAEHQINIPCDNNLISGTISPPAQPIDIGGAKVGNRVTAQPMEGWEGAAAGRLLT